MADPLLASCASSLERPFGRLGVDVNPALAFCFSGFAGILSILPKPAWRGGAVSKAAIQRRSAAALYPREKTPACIERTRVSFTSRTAGIERETWQSSLRAPNFACERFSFANGGRGLSDLELPSEVEIRERFTDGAEPLSGATVHRGIGRIACIPCEPRE
jgi:hypothetical protein